MRPLKQRSGYKNLKNRNLAGRYFYLVMSGAMQFFFVLIKSCLFVTNKTTILGMVVLAYYETTNFSKFLPTKTFQKILIKLI